MQTAAKDEKSAETLFEDNPLSRGENGRDIGTSPFRELSLLDRLLTPLLFLSMVLGVLIGEFAAQVRTALDSATFHGLSLPISIGLIVMMSAPYSPRPDSGNISVSPYSSTGFRVEVLAYSALTRFKSTCACLDVHRGTRMCWRIDDRFWELRIVFGNLNALAPRPLVSQQPRPATHCAVVAYCTMLNIRLKIRSFLSYTPGPSVFPPLVNFSDDDQIFAMPPLPIEVQALCLSDLADVASDTSKDNVAQAQEANLALRQCLFVSSTFHHLAGRHLFSKIVVPRPPIHPLELTDADIIRTQVSNLHDILVGVNTPLIKQRTGECRTISIIPFVQSFTLHMNDAWKDCIVNCGGLNRLLETLTSADAHLFRSLSVEADMGLLWSEFGTDFRRLIRGLMLKPTLRELSIEGVRELPPDILRGTSITKASLRWSTCTEPLEKGENSASAVGFPPLEDLAIDMTLASSMKTYSPMFCLRLKCARLNIDVDDDGLQAASIFLSPSFDSLTHLTLKFSILLAGETCIDLSVFSSLTNLHFSCEKLVHDDSTDSLPNLSSSLSCLYRILGTAMDVPLQILGLRFSWTFGMMELPAELYEDSIGWDKIDEVLSKRAHDSSKPLTVGINLTVPIHDSDSETSSDEDDDMMSECILRAMHRLASKGDAFSVMVSEEIIYL